MKESKLILLFITILLISSAVSGYSLFSQSIRLDEAQSIWIATKPLTTLMTLTSEDVHVPLYNFLLHFVLQLFGNTIVIARSLSYVFFLLTLPALYVLAKEASNRKTALLTVAFFSFSPFILWYTSEARMYTLFTFVTALNHIFFLRFLRSEGKTGKTGYFFSLILGMYTHYFFLFLIATQTLVIGIRMILSMRTYQERNYSVSESILLAKEEPLRFFFVLFSATLFFLPWLWFVLKGGGFSNTAPLIPPPTSFNIFQTFVNFLFGFQPQGIQAILVSLWPLIIILLFFVFTQRQRTPVQNIAYFVLTTFFPIILVFLLSFIRPIFLSRYLILVTPTLFFLIAWMLSNYSRKVSTYLSIGLLTVMFALLIYQNVSASVPVKENYEGVAAYLESHAGADDIIAVSAPFTIYPVEYAYLGQANLVTIPLWNRYTSGAIPAYSQIGFTKQMDQYKLQYQRIFVVLSYDQGYEKNIRQYLDTHYHLLDQKQFSVGLSVRVYKLRYDVS